MKDLVSFPKTNSFNAEFSMWSTAESNKIQTTYTIVNLVKIIKTAI